MLVAALPSGLWAPERAHAVGQCVSSAVGHPSLVSAGSNDIIRRIQSAAEAVACGWLLPFTIHRRLPGYYSAPAFYCGCLESAGLSGAGTFSSGRRCYELERRGLASASCAREIPGGVPCGNNSMNASAAGREILLSAGAVD